MAMRCHMNTAPPRGLVHRVGPSQHARAPLRSAAPLIRQAASSGGCGPVVHVVDDDLSVRRALARLIHSLGFGVATYASASDFMAPAPPPAPGCVILDVCMPGRSGLDLQRELSGAAPALAVVFMTAHGDIPMAVRTMKLGAVDFLEKPFNDEELSDAVRRAMARSVSACRDQDEIAALHLRRETLTQREREVLELVAAGLPNKQIGYRL